MERYVTPDGIAIYDVPSSSREGVIWHPVVNLENGDCYCECEDFKYRHYPRAREARVRIDIGRCFFHCAHIEKAIRHCIAEGDIQLVLNPKSRGGA